MVNKLHRIGYIGIGLCIPREPNKFTDTVAIAIAGRRFGCCCRRPRLLLPLVRLRVRVRVRVGVGVGVGVLYVVNSFFAGRNRGQELMGCRKV